MGSGPHATGVGGEVRSADRLVRGLKKTCITINNSAAETGGHCAGLAVRAYVRQAWNPDNRRKFAASQGPGGTGTWNASGPIDQENAFAQYCHYEDANRFLSIRICPSTMRKMQ